MNKGLQFLILIAVIFFFAKFMEPSGPRSASAVGNYDTPVKTYTQPLDTTYRYPSNCTTTSHQGPYKWDGPTHSTVCK